MAPLRALPSVKFESRSLEPLETYLLAVTLGGSALFVAVVGQNAAEFLSTAPSAFWVFTGLVVLGQMLTIKVRGFDEITSATSFLFALLLLFGLPAASFALLCSSVVSATRDHRPVLHKSFALGLQLIALSLAAAALAVLTNLPRPHASPPLEPFEVPGLFVAGGVYFLTKNFFAQMMPAVIAGEPWRAVMRQDLTLQMLTAAVFISLAPIILLAADASLSMCLLLLLPMVAIYKGGKQAVLNEHRAMHDLLTGLPNRTLFTDRIEQAIRLAQRNHGSAAVLFLDLDHFKEINDTLGHHHGDLVLRTLGPRLAEVLRASDTIARLGGDEFGILLPEALPEEAAKVASKILEALKRPLRAEHLTLQVGASIGVACSPAHGSDVVTLLQHADAAMFRAKENRNGYELYCGDEDAPSQERVLLASDLRTAVEAGDFALEYQPLIDIRSGQAAGVEALARWRHPARGLVSPAEFIPLAEQIGVIRPLTLRLLTNAAHDWHALVSAGFHVSLGINVSTRHLMSRDFVHEIIGLLRELNLPATHLKIEITETMLMSDPRHGEEVLTALSAEGVQIAIDDFGSGYSSLAYLKRLPVHELKIDKSFVSDMNRSESSMTIVRSIIQLAHNLSLRVVAEGVEDAETLQALADLGCDLAQGYFASPPLAASELREWFRHEPARLGLLELGQVPQP
jgi:diguanylate cyclase (GGDEF)-like protein